MLNTLTLDIRHFAPAPATFKPFARFTRDGSDELERHLARICSKVLAGVRRIVPARKLQGIALGGGYGRGEGGVLRTPVGDQPYNDLEFYVFVRGPVWENQRAFAGALHRLSEDLTGLAGVEVEFKLMSLARLRRSEPSMFYYDLVLGHCWLLGDDSLLERCEHHRQARLIPGSEAARLLMNRGSGLLFAREKLEHERFTPEDADFVCRNIAKAKLAIGDAVLTMFGQYHWSCVERHRRLEDLSARHPSLPRLIETIEAHAGGVEFKLHPHRCMATKDELRPEFQRVCELTIGAWLWIENRRLGGHFQSIEEYARSDRNKFPEAKPWRTALANVRAFGWRGLAPGQVLHHPRANVLKALAFLLSAASDGGPEMNEEVLLSLLADNPGESLLDRYRSLWRRVS